MMRVTQPEYRRTGFRIGFSDVQVGGITPPSNTQVLLLLGCRHVRLSHPQGRGRKDGGQEFTYTEGLSCAWLRMVRAELWKHQLDCKSQFLHLSAV